VKKRDVYRSTISINKTVDNKSPRNEFVVSIAMPQAVWTRNTVFAAMDSAARPQYPTYGIDAPE
jgi:hypothetical protein